MPSFLGDSGQSSTNEPHHFRLLVVYIYPVRLTNQAPLRKNNSLINGWKETIYGHMQSTCICFGFLMGRVEDSWPTSIITVIENSKPITTPNLRLHQQDLLNPKSSCDAGLHQIQRDESQSKHKNLELLSS